MEEGATCDKGSDKLSAYEIAPPGLGGLLDPGDGGEWCREAIAAGDKLDLLDDHDGPVDLSIEGLALVDQQLE